MNRKHNAEYFVLRFLALILCIAFSVAYTGVIPADPENPGKCIYRGDILKIGITNVSAPCQRLTCRDDGSIFIEGSCKDMISYNWLLKSVILLLIIPLNTVTTYKRNYDSRYTNSDIPEWKQRACEKSQKNKANSHYICDDKGNVKCLNGWQGDLCQVPMCRKGCDPMNGYCQRPGECRCRIGFTGEFCDKCIPLPGCQHGYCTKPFECLCKPGWDGLFCTEPTCRQGCHNTRGYCEAPGECRCRIGWAGRNCSDCSVLPGCQHGTCSKPLECKCLPGYTGLLCQTAICSPQCHKQRGYCRKPGECRCKIGWTGENCDKCFPYPGCVNGDCQQPWECNCKLGWGGMLCNEKLNYCDDHSQSCENGGKCISLTKADGSYRCHCKQGYLGKNCEIVDEFMLTSTAAPRITPPPPPVPEETPQVTTARIEIDRIDKKEFSTVNNNQTTIMNEDDNDDEDEDDEEDDDDYEEYEDDEEDLEDVNVPEKRVELKNETNKTEIKTSKPINSTSNIVKSTLKTTTNSFVFESTTSQSIKVENMSKPNAEKLKKLSDGKSHVSIGNAIDEEGFARRRNGGGSSFIFPTMSTENSEQLSFEGDIANLDVVSNTTTGVVGTAKAITASTFAV